MTLLEVILLLLGGVVFVAGFVLPTKQEEANEEAMVLSREEVKEMIAGQLEDAKIRLEETVDETVSYSVEKSERALERLSNEKIDAVSEYADTVLKDINKNHKEVMFLYDMLNEKHDSLLEAVKQADSTLGKVKEASKTAPAPKAVKPVKEEKQEEAVDDTQTTMQPVETSVAEEHFTALSQTVKAPKKKAAPKKKTTTKKASVTKEFTSTQKTEISFGDGEKRNNNEVILELYKAGKSNTAIAKELGLGVGEVKLVIDLFKGMS